MIKYTITQDSDIVKVIEAGKLELAELQVQEGQVLHNGGYDPDLYEYDSVSDEFTLRANPREKEITELTDRQIIFILLKELRKQGFSFPSLNMIVRSKRQAKDLIDLAAGRARSRYASEGNLIDQEYALAKDEILTWRAAGSPTNDIPPTLQTWIDATGMTADEAADDTIAVADQYVVALRAIRDLRLMGKAAVDTATDFQTVAQNYINQLDQL